MTGTLEVAPRRRSPAPKSEAEYTVTIQRVAAVVRPRTASPLRQDRARTEEADAGEDAEREDA